MSAIAVGLAHACALTSAGAVKCWGSGFFGELGNGANPQSSPVPVDVSGLGSGVIAIGAGVYHSCAVTDAGDAKCWGRNDFGQLGDGTHTRATSRSTSADRATSARSPAARTTRAR